VCDSQHMHDSTPPTWQARCDRLGIRVAVVAEATGYSERAVRSYREGTRRPSQDFLDRVDVLLTSIERAVEGGTAA